MEEPLNVAQTTAVRICSVPPKLWGRKISITRIPFPPRNIFSLHSGSIPDASTKYAGNQSEFDMACLRY